MDGQRLGCKGQTQAKIISARASDRFRLGAKVELAKRGKSFRSSPKFVAPRALSFPPKNSLYRTGGERGSIFLCFIIQHSQRDESKLRSAIICPYSSCRYARSEKTRNLFRPIQLVYATRGYAPRSMHHVSQLRSIKCRSAVSSLMLKPVVTPLLSPFM